MSGEKLYDAILKGDVTRFREVVQQDPYLIESASFACSRNALHIATLRGQVAMVEEVLNINPQLARDLDSQQSSPLHIAAAEGSLEMVKKLLSVTPEACWWRDCHDMNPIHIAAMNGHEEVLKELLQLNLLAAMERLHRGQTVLHLCVKHRQLNTLKVLVDKFDEFLGAKDDDGETILHLAARSNHQEITEYLVESDKIREFITMDRLSKRSLSMSSKLRSGDRRSLENIKLLQILSTGKTMIEKVAKWNDVAMVVAVLIATMAFQAAVSPPGGVWQEDTPSHSAGKAVMASAHPKIYKHFIRANATAFISSLFTIFLITMNSALPSINLFFVSIAGCAMWVSLAAIGVSYGASLMMTNFMETLSIDHVVAIVVSVFLTVYLSAFLYAFIETMSKKTLPFSLTRDRGREF
ncbi:ankyrin repeat-containing protein ITN1-like [Salvia miltiorrhiza]|uniref:ankyrin repeat-containing protein ITN1-like n=1 Tax=Salvia miltiorrhiza TaxID=226208 RepID=UPI0025AC644C|nr:ankyrin repeat-containing protein ITN1-like [Salvia miltiorrhiza]